MFSARRRIAFSLPLISLFLAFSFNSCNNEDEKPREILMTINVGDFSDEQMDAWFFLTDADGNELGTQQASPGGKLVFERPEAFNGTTVTLSSFVEKTLDFDAKYRALVSYENVTPGTYCLLCDSELAGSGGALDIWIGDVNPDYTGSFGTGRYHTVGRGVVDDTLRVNGEFMKGESTGFLYVHDTEIGNGRGVLIEDIASGKYRFSYNALETVEEYTISPNLENAEFAQSVQLGYRNGIDGSLIIHTTSAVGEEAGALKLIKADQFFDNYRTMLTVTENNIDYSLSAFGASPPTTFPKLAVNLGQYNFNGNEITFNVTGQADVMMLESYSYHESGDGVGYSDSWFCYAPVSTTNVIARVTLPSIIREKYYDYEPDFNSSYVVFSDASNAIGYDAFVQNNFDMDPAIHGSVLFKTYFVSSDGGRVNQRQSRGEAQALEVRMKSLDAIVKAGGRNE